MDPSRLNATPQPFGLVRRAEVGGAVLVWSEDPFTLTNFSREAAQINLVRPNIDRQPVCSLQWNPRKPEVAFRRLWSGEFTLLFATEPAFVVTSHQKLAALVMRCPTRLEVVEPGACYEGWPAQSSSLHCSYEEKPPRPIYSSYEELVEVVRNLVLKSVARNAAAGDALLLSGGVDSSIIAAVAKHLGAPLRTFTIALRNPPKSEEYGTSDRLHAQGVAQRLGLSHRTIELDASRLVRNVPIAIYLGETARGTIVDELVMHVEAAQVLASWKINRILTGGGADDLFGTFPFVLRYYRGAQLRAHLQRGLLKALPDELALMQNVYSAWRISLVHPYWSEDLRAIGYHLPLRYRVDGRRLMKRVLRDAFKDLLCELLGEDTLLRPKGVPRDCAQVRPILAEKFGVNPQRYRRIFSKMMKRRTQWPRELSTLRKN